MKLPKKNRNNDWSGKSVNFCTGCEHDCLYCYSKDMADKFGWGKMSTWKEMKVREKDVKKKHKDYGLQVMIPTSHDITPTVIEPAVEVINNLLIGGNKRVLIVSKPHFSCIERICREFESYKSFITFRFTIGACDDEILSFWEPGAPDFKERMECLQYAYRNDFKTSVSIEPVLDFENLELLVDKVRAYTSHSIWIGSLNPSLRRIKALSSQVVVDSLNQICKKQTPQNFKDIYQKFSKDSLIHYIGKVRKIIGLSEIPPEYI